MPKNEGPGDAASRAVKFFQGAAAREKGRKTGYLNGQGERRLHEDGDKGKRGAWA